MGPALPPIPTTNHSARTASLRAPNIRTRGPRHFMSWGFCLQQHVFWGHREKNLPKQGNPRAESASGSPSAKMSFRPFPPRRLNAFRRTNLLRKIASGRGTGVPSTAFHFPKLILIYSCGERPSSKNFPPSFQVVRWKIPPLRRDPTRQAVGQTGV